MKVQTPNGKMHDILFGWGPTTNGTFMCRIVNDDRPLWEIAKDFSEQNVFDVIDAHGVRTTCSGFNTVVSVIKNVAENCVDVEVSR